MGQETSGTFLAKPVGLKSLYPDLLQQVLPGAACLLLRSLRASADKSRSIITADRSAGFGSHDISPFVPGVRPTLPPQGCATGSGAATGVNIVRKFPTQVPKSGCWGNSFTKV